MAYELARPLQERVTLSDYIAVGDDSSVNAQTPCDSVPMALRTEGRLCTLPDGRQGHFKADGTFEYWFTGVDTMEKYMGIGLVVGIAAFVFFGMKGRKNS